MKRIAVVANRDKPRAFIELEKIQQWAQDHGIDVATDLRELPGGDTPCAGGFILSNIHEIRQRYQGCDLAVTLGGDGTLLYGAHIFAPLGVPVLAANLGNLGFHAQIVPDEILTALDAVLAGDFRTEPRLLLQAQLQSAESEPEQTRDGVTFALNDIVVSRSAWGKMVHLRLFANGQAISDLSADGLVVATPTGSSAYNYAARGPILEPDFEAIVLNAICPHRMNFSPLVVSANTEVVIAFHPRKPLEEAQLLVDGQPWCSVSHDEELKISRAPMYLPLIVFENNFFRKLREKLAWGGLS